jgi:hypothetical protein
VGDPADSIDVDHEVDSAGHVVAVRIRFGPHHLVEVRKAGGTTSFLVVSTHYGFRVDASEVGGELDQVIGEIRERHPDPAVD